MAVAAHRDAVVGRALSLLHAERFHTQVGQPPLTYLTHWRMILAADLLVERETATIAVVARL